jgi:RNA polymerase primary sigma factor/RNA polymerase sigma factor
MMDFNSARQEVEKSNFKFWFLEEFEDDKKVSEILGEMPDIEEFEKKKLTIQKDLNKVTPELRQFYCEPLLTKAQEFHLFRKMNYFKFIAVRNYRRYCRTKLAKLKQNFVACLEAAQEVRNKIVCCNTRLAAQVYKKRKDYYGDDIDNLLSDCFANIIKAVDGFDFTRGFKFSTYCTWVLMNNSLRDHHSDKKFQEKFTTNVADTNLKNQVDEKNLDEDLKRERVTAINDDVSYIFAQLSKKDQREADILMDYYGIKDGKRKTLKEISENLDITKERVRQIRNSAISYVKNLLLLGEIKMKSADYLT